MTAVQSSPSSDFERSIERARHISPIELRACKPAQIKRRQRPLMQHRNITGFEHYTEVSLDSRGIGFEQCGCALAAGRSPERGWLSDDLQTIKRGRQ